MCTPLLRFSWNCSYTFLRLQRKVSIDVSIHCRHQNTFEVFAVFIFILLRVQVTDHNFTCYHYTDHSFLFPLFQNFVLNHQPTKMTKICTKHKHFSLYCSKSCEQRFPLRREETWLSPSIYFTNVVAVWTPVSKEGVGFTRRCFHCINPVLWQMLLLKYI